MFNNNFYISKFKNNNIIASQKNIYHIGTNKLQFINNQYINDIVLSFNTVDSKLH